VIAFPARQRGTSCPDRLNRYFPKPQIQQSPHKAGFVGASFGGAGGI